MVGFCHGGNLPASHDNDNVDDEDGGDDDENGIDGNDDDWDKNANKEAI